MSPHHPVNAIPRKKETTPKYKYILKEVSSVKYQIRPVATPNTLAEITIGQGLICTLLYPVRAIKKQTELNRKQKRLEISLCNHRFSFSIKRR